MTYREEALARAFVDLADTLVKDFDIVDFLAMLTEHCLEILDAHEVGVVLADANGKLHVMASSSEHLRVLELFELQANDGPSREAFKSGQQLVNISLDEPNDWPVFSTEAVKFGFRMMHAFPLRLRDQSLGAINVFHVTQNQISQSSTEIAQALADAATIGILQERLLRENTELATQLQRALNTRIIVEQAKGVIAERLTVDTNEAFVILRNYARHNNLRLADIARDVTEGGLRNLHQ